MKLITAGVMMATTIDYIDNNMSLSSNYWCLVIGTLVSCGRSPRDAARVPTKGSVGRIRRVGDYV